MDIKLYNTLTKRKERFEPIHPKRVTMYVCGPTVYNYVHIGNARPFIFFDVVRRYLEYKGYNVKYVQNLTDIDDKLIMRAKDLDCSVQDIATKYIDAYFQDMEALGMKKSDVHPRATENILEMIAVIQSLVDQGFAYESKGDVYFRSQRKEDYGQLAQQSLDELKIGARIQVSEKKEQPLDFTLWKSSHKDEVGWESPWGYGRPGWHTECSAMVRKYLGDTIDIHAGGIDLRFPHHENERVQSEVWTGQPFVRYWLHNAFVQMSEEKMSKSLGNVKQVVELRQEYSPLALRYFLLSAHYRHPIQFNDEVLIQAEASIKRIETAVVNLNHRQQHVFDGPLIKDLSINMQDFTNQFEQAMNDDLNTANAISVIFEVVKFTNEALRSPVLSKQSIETLLNWFKLYAGDILGLQTFKKHNALDEWIEKKIAEREAARKLRNFKEADEIRKQLLKEGIVLEDTPQGIRWRIINK